MLHCNKDSASSHLEMLICSWWVSSQSDLWLQNVEIIWVWSMKSITVVVTFNKWYTISPVKWYVYTWRLWQKFTAIPQVMTDFCGYWRFCHWTRTDSAVGLASNSVFFCKSQDFKGLSITKCTQPDSIWDNDQGWGNNYFKRQWRMTEAAAMKGYGINSSAPKRETCNTGLTKKYLDWPASVSALKMIVGHMNASSHHSIISLQKTSSIFKLRLA